MSQNIQCTDMGKPKRVKRIMEQEMRLRGMWNTATAPQAVSRKGRAKVQKVHGQREIEIV